METKPVLCRESEISGEYHAEKIDCFNDAQYMT